VRLLYVNDWPGEIGQLIEVTEISLRFVQTGSLKWERMKGSVLSYVARDVKPKFLIFNLFV